MQVRSPFRKCRRRVDRFAYSAWRRSVRLYPPPLPSSDIRPRLAGRARNSRQFGSKLTFGAPNGAEYVNARFSVTTGSDITGDAAIFQGAHGLIVGVTNIDPHGFMKMYNAASTGDWKTARVEQERLHKLRLIAKIAGGRVSGFSATIGAFKAAQVHRGVIDNDLLQPLLQSLNAEERSAVVAVVTSQGLGQI